MPVPVLERDEASAADASNRPRAGSTPLGEKLAKALGTVRFVVARRESLSRQGVVAVAAGETISVPRLVLVCHTSASNNLVALNTPSGELVLVTCGAVNLLLARDEALRADRVLADHAAEAFLVPLSGLIFHLLSTGTEDIAACIATSGELGIVAVAAVDLVHFATKLFVHQGHFTLGAEEASLMPVFILVRQILRFDADDFATLLAAIGENALVTLNAVGMLVPEDIALSC